MSSENSSFPEHWTRVLFVHAHPDDETLSTGALMLTLARKGVEVDLVTCTRGERGDVVAGVLPEGADEATVMTHRLGELANAVSHLGVASHCFLGAPPASRDNQHRTYSDSGMEWIRPGLAGPASDVTESAFSVQPLPPLVDDLSAWLESRPATAIISYDPTGGYGHPDHVRAHEVSAACAQRNGVQFWQVLPDDEPPAPGDLWADYRDHRDALVAAHDSHASQFTRTGDLIVHVGESHQHDIRTRIGLRRA